MTLLCFRCDRQVDARPGRPCPRCGATLVAPPAPVTTRTPDRADDMPLAVSAPRPERRTAPVAGVVAVVVLAALVLGPRVWRPADEVTPTPAEPHLGPVDRPVVQPLSGRLAYVAEDRLWVVDVASGVTRRGPAVDGEVAELVDLSEAHAGWVGAELGAPEGSRRAVAFRGLEPRAEPFGLTAGDRFAWGPGGSNVVAATDERAEDGCSEVTIEVVTVRTGVVERLGPSPDVCGPLLSLGRSSVATYFTAETRTGVDTFFSGVVGVPHLLFGNTRMLSASPLGQFLVTVPAERSMPAPDEALFLAWRGRGGPLQVRVGDEPLRPGRIVAWSPDGGLVALLGTVEDRTGLYVLQAGSGAAAREPRLVTSGEVLDATFGPDGSLFVVGHGAIHVWRDGRLGRLLLSDGVPPPAGQVVWLP